MNIPKHTLQYTIALLQQARSRLDATHCEGKTVGPDATLATQIDNHTQELKNLVTQN